MFCLMVNSWSGNTSVHSSSGKTQDALQLDSSSKTLQVRSARLATPLQPLPTTDVFNLRISKWFSDFSTLLLAWFLRAERCGQVCGPTEFAQLLDAVLWEEDAKSHCSVPGEPAPCWPALCHTPSTSLLCLSDALVSCFRKTLGRPFLVAPSSVLVSEGTCGPCPPWNPTYHNLPARKP